MKLLLVVVLGLIGYLVGHTVMLMLMNDNVAATLVGGIVGIVVAMLVAVFG